MQNPGADDDGHGHGHSSQPHASGKTQRVLACLLCQQRKVKCDRKFPCANCTRSGAQCVPATLLPRQRRRRFPERELLDRLRHYEKLLRDNNIDFEPLHKPQGAPTPDFTKRESIDSSAQDNSNHNNDSPSTQAPSPSDKLENEYKAKDIWSAMGHPATDWEENDSEGETRAEGVKKLWDRVYSQNDHIIFGTRVDTVDLSPLHPGPADIFRLWQTYMDNVNSILHVLHPPTIQGRIIEAAGNTANVDPVLEALMFAIYSLAVISLRPEECQSLFLEEKQDLLLRYQFGCQQALVNAGLLKTSSRDVLTAYYLYLVSLAGSTHPQTVYSLLAIAVRIAKRLGMHNEARLAEHSPFEAEMRRKLWWSLVLFDARTAEKTDSKNTSLNPSWDCKVPLNIGDADLRPESKDLQPVSGRCTEAIFGVVRSELGNYLRHNKSHLEFCAPSLRSIAHRGLEIDELQKQIEDRYLKYTDPTNPLHYLAKWTTHSLVARYGLWRLFSKFADADSPRPSSTDRDEAIMYGIRMLEADKYMIESPLTKRYHWFLGFFFPLPAYLVIAKSLRMRPDSPYQTRAWEAMSQNFQVRVETVFRQEVAPFMKLFSPLYPAWDACVKANAARDAAAGVTQQSTAATPKILAHIREIRSLNITTAGSSPSFHTDTDLSTDDEMILTPDLFHPSFNMPFVGFSGSNWMFDGTDGGTINWSPPPPQQQMIPPPQQQQQQQRRQASQSQMPPVGGPMAPWFANLPPTSTTMNPMMTNSTSVPDHKALETLNLGNIDWDAIGRDEKMM